MWGPQAFISINTTDILVINADIKVSMSEQFLVQDECFAICYQGTSRLGMGSEFQTWIIVNSLVSISSVERGELA